MSYSTKTTDFGEFWGRDWSLNQYVEAPESRWEHDFDFLPPTGARCDWILTRPVNDTESRQNTIFLFSSVAQNSNRCSRVFLKCVLMIPTKIVGSCGSNHSHGRNHSRFFSSCFHLVCFLRESTEFCDMRTKCQRILIHYLLLLSHKLLAIAC